MTYRKAYSDDEPVASKDRDRCPDWPDAPQYHGNYCPAWHTNPGRGPSGTLKASPERRKGNE